MPELNDYKNLIYKFAHRYENYGLEFEDLVSEGYIVFYESLNTYDAKQGKFSTHLYWSLRGKFGIMLRNKTETKELDANVFDDRLPNPDKTIIFKEAMSKLSYEAQFIVDIVWDTPATLLTWCVEEMYSPKLTMRRIKRYLLKQNWKHTTINDGFKEIQQILKNLK